MFESLPEREFIEEGYDPDANKPVGNSNNSNLLHPGNPETARRPSLTSATTLRPMVATIPEDEVMDSSEAKSPSPPPPPEKPRQKSKQEDKKKQEKQEPPRPQTTSEKKTKSNWSMNEWSKQ